MPNQGVVLAQHTGNETVRFRVIAKGQNSTWDEKYTRSWVAPTYSDFRRGTFRIPLHYLSGDFNGDGLSDVITIEKRHKGNWQGKAHFINLDRRLSSSNFVKSVGKLSAGVLGDYRLYSLDANGDGKTNIIQLTDGHIYVYGLNHANNSLDLLWKTTDTRLKPEFPIYSGDYNGDGKTDFFIPTKNLSENFVFFFSTGDSFKAKEYKDMGFYYAKPDTNDENHINSKHIIPIDINGDGKTDIIWYGARAKKDTDDGGVQTIYLFNNTYSSNANNYPEFKTTSEKIHILGNIRARPIPIFLSSNQRNHNLEFAVISNKWVRSYRSRYDHREDVSLKEITNNGLSTKITYDRVMPGSNQNNTYTAHYDQAYPFVNINAAPSFKVVKELEQTGSNITRNQQFYYEGAVSHVGGLGFMGFKVLKRSNWHGENVPALWTISKQDPLLRGAVTEKITSPYNTTNPSSYATKENYNYDYELLPNPGAAIFSSYPSYLQKSTPVSGSRFDGAENYIKLLPGFHASGINGTYTAKIMVPERQSGAAGYAGTVNIRLKSMTSNNALTGVTTSESYTYDSYNNQTRVTTSFPGGSKTVDYTYSNNPGVTDNTYHIGKQKVMKESITRDGNTFTTEEQYEYTNNLVVKIKRKGHNTNWLTEELTYDTYGNVITKVLKANNLADRVQRFEYGAAYKHRFMTKSVDIDGLATTFTYNSLTGNLITTKDPFGHTTAYTHDSWGRMITSSDYLNKVTHSSYTQLSGGGLKYAVNYPDGAKEITHYNTFGWATRKGALSLNNQWVHTDYEYYVSGQLKRQSEPHHGSANQWNSTTYDLYGRPILQESYTGKNTTISYSKLTTTVNDGIKNVSTTKDALGSVVKIQDPGGTVNYTYFASGQLKTANYGSHTVTINVDGWGRKTSLNDPSAGTYTYTYNDYGDVLEQTTPKGKTTYQYDNFGRVTHKAVEGDLTDLSLSYLYDNATKLLTQINGVDNTNNGRAYSYEYTYDSYQRPTVTKENTGLANYENRIEYDGNGRVAKETQVANLASGPTKTLTTRNVYDSSGMLTEIWNEGTPKKLWQLNSINARGQALSVTLGNGIVKNKTYDGYGYLTKIEDKKASNDPNPNIALHTQYDFNAQYGTLNSRENLRFNWQENFEYDNQYRLTTISGSVTKTMSYDNRGRIENNSDLGDYDYNQSNTYRLQEITPNANGTNYFELHTVQQITYNAYKKPVDIHETGKGRVSFEYDPMMNRSTAYYGGEDEDRLSRRYRKHYSSILPIEIVEDTQAGSTKIINYIAGNGYTAPIVHIKQTGANAIDDYHYLHRDYLGSILAITNAEGVIQEERQFGAWGTVDTFLDSSGNTSFGHTSLLGRGYTGHEHFFDVGLIHMNGRMYDANLGRFLSPDNYIQDPYNTQNYNRYAYVLNNPLMFNDPSGETIEPITLAIILSVAIIGAAAIFGDWEGASAASNTPKSSPPTPGSQNNSEMASSISSGQSRDSGGSAGSRGGFEGVQTPIQPPFSRIPLPEASVATFANISSSNSGVYGVSQTGRPELVSFLDGAPKQDFSGFWGKAKYLWTGGNVDGYRYNMDGEALSLAPKMGIPDIGIGRLGSLAKLAKQVSRVFRGTRDSGRVFWSGQSAVAGKAAENFAKANGMKTLEMTWQGKALTRLTNATSYKLTAPLWNRASASFARGATGSINVFHNASSGVRLNSVWRNIEYPILNGNNRIIYHNVFK